MQFIVVNQVQKKHPAFSTKKIEVLASRCVRLLMRRRLRNRLFLSRHELTIVILPALEMKKINRQFRKKNKPTDVLSFESASAASLGEILLCPDVLVKQAQEHQVPIDSELSLMLIHGLLHLLGYDHETSSSDDRLMKQHQQQVLKRLKLDSRN